MRRSVSSRWRTGTRRTRGPGSHHRPRRSRYGRGRDGLPRRTALDDTGAVVSAGGRVLAVTGVGDTLAAARARTYAALDRISFAGMRARTDIAAAAATGGTGR